MRIQFFDELGDTLFAVAMVGAIGLAASNLAVQVNKERGAFDAAAIMRQVGQVPSPPSPVVTTAPRTEVPAVEEVPAAQLNY
jgi:hypothetical protein